MIIDSSTDFLEGQVLLFDKPLYWTSFDLVKKVKNLIRNTFGYKKIKVGHAGTLDPLADGLLIVCTGKFTKTISSIQEQPKEYVATIKLGETTPSFDLETEVDKTFKYEHITEQLIREIFVARLGEQDQIPPVFSAKRVNGKRAYEYARKGIDIKLDPKRITYYELELLSFNMPYIRVRIKCSKGTYIRSFARDLGEWCESGAHLTVLTRTYIGEYSVDNAISIEDFEKVLSSL